MPNHKFQRILVLVFFMLGLTACGGGGNGSTTNNTQAASDNARLAGITLSTGTLQPAFLAETTSYSSTVSAATTVVTVTPIARHTNAKVVVNGTAVVSGTRSGAIALAVGDTDINIVVTAEDGITTKTYIITITRQQLAHTLELIDPTPRAGDEFGSHVVTLTNGNIVVTDPLDSSVVAINGAVHLFSRNSSTPIASIYGDGKDDGLGNGGVVALDNGNFIIVSPFDNENGITTAGSIRLINGNTGVQIGNALVGIVTVINWVAVVWLHCPIVTRLWCRLKMMRTMSRT